MYSPNHKRMPSLSVKSWDADLIAVEVMGLLSAFSFCAYPIADLRQRFVGVLVGVDIGVVTVKYGTKKVV